MEDPPHPRSPSVAVALESRQTEPFETLAKGNQKERLPLEDPQEPASAPEAAHHSSTHFDSRTGKAETKGQDQATRSGGVEKQQDFYIPGLDRSGP